MLKKSGNLLTTTAAAKRLGVARGSIQGWVDKGVLKAMRTPGGHRRITRESVESLLDEWNADMAQDPQPETAKILIVEDDPVFMEYLLGTLRSWQAGFDIITAENGFDGLLQIGRLNPDIVISDLKMPNMDGCEMIRVLRSDAHYSTIDIIVISSLDQQEIDQRGGLPDGIPVFKKPAPSAELKKRVLAHLEARRRPGRG
ncbi:MAG: response regulator [Magnetococcales bacterium]|nr:response regulator [Magnetococcales bacterium]